MTTNGCVRWPWGVRKSGFVQAGALMVFLFLGSFTARAQQLTQSWANRVDGPAHSMDQVAAIVADSSDNSYVTGQVCVATTSSGFCNGTFAMLTVKYDKAGNVVWQNQTTAGGSRAGGSAIAVDGGGNVYVTGNADQNIGIVTVKYSPTGQQLWLATVNLSSGNSSAVAAKIAVDSAGNSYIAVGGQIAAPGGAAAIKYDPNGNLLWKTGSFSITHWFPAGIAVDAQGSLYMVGESDDNSAFLDCCGGFTQKLDTNGNLLWFDNSGFNNSAIVLDAAGNAYVTGITSNGLSTFNISDGARTEPVQESVTKYDPAGNHVWVALYQTPGGTTNVPSAIALDGSGNVYTSGRSVAPANPSGNDYSTVKFDTTGKPLWEALYNGTGTGNDIAVGLALDSFANVYVTGQSTSTGGATDQDYATVEYDTNGNQLSVARYNGPQNLDDIPAGIAFGSTIALVTGTSPLDFTQDNLWDWATVAYAPSGASPVLLSSISVSPSSVTGGTETTGTVTLNAPAPLGGATVSLTNNNSSAAQVPSSITVPAGSTSATFTVITNPVTAVTSVMITGNYYAAQSTTLTVSPSAGGGGGPIALVQQATASYSSSSAVSVNLAPRPGDALVLFSDNDSVNISSVTGGGVIWVRGSSSSAHAVGEIWYGLNSSGSGSSITVTYVDATGSGGVNVSEFSGVATSNALDVAPGPNTGISTTPTAPVAVTTNANDLILAAAADINAASTTAGPTNSFTALAEAASDEKIIPAYLIASATGSYSTSWTEGNGGWDAITVALKAAGTSSSIVSLSSISLNPSTVSGGNSSTGTITLSAPAPSGGATVMLTSNKASVAQVPSSVTVPAGSSSATFTATTSASEGYGVVTIVGTYNQTQTATLTVQISSGGGNNPIAFVQQATATYASSSTVNVTLSSAPRPGDAMVLFSDNDSVGISSVSGGGVSWVRGSSSGTHAVAEIWYGLNSSGSGSSITVTYVGAGGSGGVNVSEFSGVAASNALDLAPGSSSGISTRPTTVSLGTDNANDLILAAAADINTSPTTGAPLDSFIALTEAAASDSKIIPAYRIVTAFASYSTSWGEGDGGWDAIIVALKAAGSLSSVSFSPSSVTGGNSSTGTVTLSGPAPSGGATVTLTSNTTGVQVPSTVTVPSGSTSATFTVTTSAVMTVTSVIITADYQGTQTGTLTVTPSASGGGQKALVQQATATYSTTNSVTVTLNAPPQSGDALVLFSSNDSVYISSVSGGGVTWVLGSASGQHSVAEIWYGLNSSGSGTPITVTYSGMGSGGVNVSEFSGVATTNALDVAPGSASGVSATPTTPIATTTNATDLILAAAADESVAATTAGPTNSFTALTEAADGSKLIPAYQIVSATGSYSTNWTEGNDGWDAVIVALK